MRLSCVFALSAWCLLSSCYAPKEVDEQDLEPRFMEPVSVPSSAPDPIRDIRFELKSDPVNPIVGPGSSHSVDQIKLTTQFGDMICTLDANSETIATIVGEYMVINLGDDAVDYALRTKTSPASFPAPVTFADKSGRLKFNVRYDPDWDIADQNATHGRYGPPYFSVTLDGQEVPNWSSTFNYLYPYFSCDK